MDEKSKLVNMADVRLLVQEEGRAARNLIAFNVPLEADNIEKITRKPPSVPKILQPANAKRSIKSNARIRSASTGRDKRSELQARHWAFLFGNLQRAVDAIYETCEEDENISECKEVILVLENYTRDFHNLIEWFKVKWAYETSPPPLRRTPLAWEVRKTSPCRMWNSSIVSKPNSPLQRISPTSSIEQTIVEHKVISNDNKIESSTVQVKSDVLINSKFIKESKNKNSKDDGKTLKEKTAVITAATKLNTRTTNVLKRPTSNKNQENDLKTSVENNVSTTKASIDVKNSNISRNAGRLQQTTTINRIKAVNLQSSNTINNNNENNIDAVSKKNNEIKKDGEATKNQTQTNLNKNSTLNGLSNKSSNKLTTSAAQKTKPSVAAKPAYSTISRMKTTLNSTVPQQNEIPKMVRSKTTLGVRGPTTPSKIRPGTSVMMRKGIQTQREISRRPNSVRSDLDDISASVEVLHPQSKNKRQQQPQQQRHQQQSTPQYQTFQASQPQYPPKEDVDGWQTVRGRCRRSSTHNLNMSTRFHRPSTASSLPALCIDSGSDKSRQKRRSIGAKVNEPPVDTAAADKQEKLNAKKQEDKEKLKGCEMNGDKNEASKSTTSKSTAVKQPTVTSATNETSAAATATTASEVSENRSTSLTIAAIFKNEAELLEKRIQQFMAAQAERERIILEEERKTEEADSQRSKQLSDEEALLQRQILELESTEIDVDTETDETDGEMMLDADEESIAATEGLSTETASDTDTMSLEDRYENMLEGMSWAERMDTLAQLQALVARHPGRALELHQKLSSPSRKRSLPETLRRYQAKQACAQHKRQKLLMEKSQRLRELLNKVEDVKSAKNQLIEDKRVRLELKLKRAEENRTQHLLEVVRKAHDEDSKLREIAFINELEAQNKRHDFMALCQEQEERLQGIQEERQRRQEEKAAKEAAAEERRRALEAERQLRIQRMRQARREREERVGKMQLEREKERQELAREKARDREERLSALHAAQLANQEELQKKIAQKQQDSARRHVENIEHIRQRALESSIMRAEELPPTLKTYPCPKQCQLCDKLISNEVQLLSHLKGKLHSEAVRRVHEGREPCRDELHKFNISQIKDSLQLCTPADSRVAKERQKALKRRSRKIKQRMLARSLEDDKSSPTQQQQQTIKSATTLDSPNKANFRRNLKELDKLCQSHAKNAWNVSAVAGLERCLGQIARAFSKTCPQDQAMFLQLGGFETLTNLMNLTLNVQNSSQTLPNKSIVSICRVYVSALSGHLANIEAVFLSNKIIVILDLLMQRLEMVTSLEDGAQQAQEVSSGNGSVVVATMQLLCALVPETSFDKPALHSRLQDAVSYLMTSGLIERLSRHSHALIESEILLDQERDCSALLIVSYDFLWRVCEQFKRSTSLGPSSSENCSVASETTESSGNSGSEPSVARTHLLGQLESSEAAGTVGALYATIVLATSTSANQRSGNSSSTSPTPSQQAAGLSQATKNLAYKGLKLLRSMATLDLQKFQNLLGSEGTSLQWRLIANHLITKLSRDLSDKPETPTGVYSKGLLSELFVVLGYFTLSNTENQMTLQSTGGGIGPSVLQQLCTLPFPFYGDPQLAAYTLPTLLTATHDNPEAKAVLTCEMSYQLLEEYGDSESGKLNPLLRLLRSSSSSV